MKKTKRFQMIFKVPCDDIVQMHTVSTHHVVTITRIGEEVWIGVGINAGTHEGQGVLGHTDRVVTSVDDKETPFQVLGFVEQGGLFVALWIGLWGVHVAFTIHDFIEAPIDDRSSCHSHLEDIGIGGHEAGGHEASKAPTMHTQAVGINIGKTLQIVHTTKLVFHLFHTQMTEGGLFKSKSAMLTATIVKTEHHITLLRHPDVPTPCSPIAGGIDVVGMRTAINIHHCRIFLVGVKVGGKDETIVEVCHSIGCLDGARLDFRHLEILPRVISCEKVEGGEFGVDSGDNVNLAGNVG